MNNNDKINKMDKFIKILKKATEWQPLILNSKTYELIIG
jgi:hypothetical protein